MFASKVLSLKVILSEFFCPLNLCIRLWINMFHTRRWMQFHMKGVGKVTKGWRHASHPPAWLPTLNPTRFFFTKSPWLAERAARRFLVWPQTNGSVFGGRLPCWCKRVGGASLWGKRCDRRYCLNRPRRQRIEWRWLGSSPCWIGQFLSRSRGFKHAFRSWGLALNGYHFNECHP